MLEKKRISLVDLEMEIRQKEFEAKSQRENEEHKMRIRLSEELHILQKQILETEVEIKKKTLLQLSAKGN